MLEFKYSNTRLLGCVGSPRCCHRAQPESQSYLWENLARGSPGGPPHFRHALVFCQLPEHRAPVSRVSMALASQHGAANKHKKSCEVDFENLFLHEGVFLSHAVLGGHLTNTNSHGLKFDYVMGNGMHEWTQVLNLPVY